MESCWVCCSRSAHSRRLKAQPPANAPKVVEVEKVKDNLYVLQGRRRQHRRVRHGRRRHRRRREEPGLGPADPRQGQGADAEADHDADQHAHARRSRQRQRRVPGDGRRRRAGKHEGQHGEDGHLQAEQQPRHGQADVQGQDDHRQAAPTRSTSTTSARATPTATRGSSSRRCARRTRATSSPARDCRSSTATTAAACCTTPRR